MNNENTPDELPLMKINEHPKELFSWIRSFMNDGEKTIIEFGDGYCTMDPDPDAYATIHELRRHEKPGSLCSATALLILDDGQQYHYIMCERDSAAAVDPNKWQFPAGRMGYGESPNQTALREAYEEVEIMQNGLQINLMSATLLQLGRILNLQYKDEMITAVADYIINSNTLEFFIPLIIRVDHLDNIECYDKEPYKRKVSIMTEAEVNQLLEGNKLTGAASTIWGKWSCYVKQRHTRSKKIYAK